MLTVKTFPLSPIDENCYVISDSTREAVIIDCGCFYDDEWATIHSYIQDNQLTVRHLLNTHAHFDHIFGEGYVHSALHLTPEGSILDQQLYLGFDQQLVSILGLQPSAIRPRYPLPPFHTFLRRADTVSFGNHQLTVIETPGHTPGGLCFYCKDENVLFTGDTLFRLSIGRTDFPGGSHSQIIQSITAKLLTLPSQTIVYPGHGPSTTIGYEAQNNPNI